MLIRITTERRVYVSVRKYDKDGVFTNGDYSDATRGIFVDATRVEVAFKAPTSGEGPYNTPRITAQLMGKTCKCSEPEYVLTFQFFHIRVTSPGFPDFSQYRQQDPSRPMRAMVFEAQDMVLDYNPSNSIQTRFFEMNITRMNVLEVTFKLENPYKTDLIYMYSDHMMEEYGYGELSHVRQVTSPSAISMTFSRMKWFATPNATLKISWEQIEHCLCPEESFHLTEGTSLVITSPHWPQQYCSMLLCRHTFFAPKGHFLEVVIDNADIERYHDYLKIYDGNSTTDPLLMKVSGLYEKVIQFNSTQNTVIVANLGV
ncbi:unnamed protein product [Caenorhabditis nigoni]